MTLADVCQALRRLHTELSAAQYDDVTSLDAREIAEARQLVWEALSKVSRVDARAAADEALSGGFNGEPGTWPDREPSTS